MFKLKQILKKVWRFIKGNYLLLLVIVAVAFVMFRGCDQFSAYDKLMSKYNQQIEDTQERIEKLKEIQKKQAEKREELNQKYQEKLKKLEEDYKKRISEIRRSKFDRQSRIVKEAEKDPSSLIKKVEEKFGIPEK